MLMNMKLIMLNKRRY